MCGICGVFHYARAGAAVDEGVLKAMRDTMTHRGPDGEGLWISNDGQVGLGHRRLSIIDLSPAGKQPMTNEDGAIWLTFNGEIYNHQKLRAELEPAGHRYRSRSDSESLIHGYEQWGMGLLDRLEGMFAFAIHDRRSDSMLLVRDRLGVKPLYFALTNGALIFGSEIKAILMHPEIERDVDPASLSHYLTFITTPAPRTLFKGIYKLPPGGWMRVHRGGKIETGRYWDAIRPVPENVAQFSDVQWLTGRVRELLHESVEKRMISDVPFGVLLSGGVDSTTIVSLMSGMMDRPVKTFSIGFKVHEHLNELDYARAVAKEYKTDHHEVLIDEKEMLEFLPDLIIHQDEPISDWVCIPLYFVSKLARQNGCIVVQVGEGSDELFCGYGHYMEYLNRYHRANKYLSKIPKPLRGMALAAIGAEVACGGIGKKLYPDMLRLHQQHFFMGGAALWMDELKERLLVPGALKANEPRVEDSFFDLSGHATLDSHAVVDFYYRRLEQAHGKPDFLDQMTYLELKLRLPELLLMRVDKMTMATSIEAREPFLDHALVELAANIPENVKTRNRQEPKAILKAALRGVIPDSIIDRPKMGFGAPMREWLRGPFGQYARDRLMSGEYRKRGVFNYDFIDWMCKEHQDGRADYSNYIWNLLNFSLWYDHWIARKPA